MSLRTLSPETKSLIEQLRGPARSLKQVLVRPFGDSPASVLDQLVARGEPLTLGYVLPYAFDTRRAVARAAARAVSSILNRVPVSELPWLDEQLRARSTWGSTWFGMTPADLDFHERFGSEAGALLGLATCHPSGYVREAGLKALQQTRDGSELPFVLIRLNDWVLPVRALAMSLMQDRIRTEYARQLVTVLPLVIRLRSTQRTNHAQTINAILGVLRLPESRDALLQGTKSADRQIRRMAFELAAEGGAQPVETLFKAALADNDPHIRLWAARDLAASMPDDALDVALEALEKDRIMAVRREALELRLARRPESVKAKLLASLCDRSTGIRSFCQYHLRTRFQHDPVVDYRISIDAKAAKLPYALAGLGEVGEPSDIARVEPFLTDSRPRVRAAATRTLGRLSKEPPIPPLLRAVQDESPSVSREGRDALRRIAFRVPVDDLRDAFRNSRHAHVRKYALSLLATADLWDGAPTLIAASADAQDDLRRMGRALLGAWLFRTNRVWVVPTGRQLEQIQDALTAHGESMDTRQRDQLTFMLRTTRQ
jgi:HEAT repeat protein